MKKLLVNKIFLENRNIIEDYMKKKDLSKNQVISDLTTFLNNLNMPLHIEKKGKAFQIKDVSDYLPVKLGLYGLSNEKDLNPEMFVQQCTIYPTIKGKEIYSEYKRLNSK